MSRPIFDMGEMYEGAGNQADYTFDFKITDLKQIVINKYDDDGELVFSERGDSFDTDNIESIDFDAIDGGGTVTLAEDLESDYWLQILLAYDEPNQTYEFRDKSSFTLRSLENALDNLSGGIQRAIYLALRSIRLNDFDSIDDFDPMLPVKLNESTGFLIGLNADRSGLAIYSAEDVANGITGGESQAITNSMSATDVEDATVDSAEHTSAIFTFEIIRSTTIFMIQTILLAYRNGAWEKHEGPILGAGVDHGLTWSVTEAGGVAQLRVASDASGVGTLKFKRMAFDA